MNPSNNSFIQAKRETTRKLLSEIKSISGKKWNELSMMLEVDCPDINCSVDRLKKCASSSTTYLRDNEMIRIASWAMTRNFGGEQCLKLSQQRELTADEVELNKHLRRNANSNLDCERQNELISQQYKKQMKSGKTSTAQLKGALDEICRAGFTPAEVLYMTYSWLLLNYPKLSDKIPLPGIVEVDKTIYRFVDLSNLPKSLVLPASGNDSECVMIDVRITKY